MSTQTKRPTIGAQHIEEMVLSKVESRLLLPGYRLPLSLRTDTIRRTYSPPKQFEIGGETKKATYCVTAYELWIYDSTPPEGRRVMKIDLEFTWLLVFEAYFEEEDVRLFCEKELLRIAHDYLRAELDLLTKWAGIPALVIDVFRW